ncbi:hypothetical protein ACNOYE_39450 [Nannocystaceae bacterium ST9]
MPASPIEELEVQLAANPTDEALRAKLAGALTELGRHADAAGVLGSGLKNLTAHDGPTLPCLCRRCLQPELVVAQADGMQFRRRFAVARGRVLWYWVPLEFADDESLARSVTARLDARLSA